MNTGNTTISLYVRPPMAAGSGYSIHQDKRTVVATVKDEVLAHLFAAAPELLAALQAVTVFIEKIPMQGNYKQLFEQHYPWHVVQAALTKAKGQL